jgi:hypothetical protein
VGRNILIVESKNDKYFFQAVIKHLNYDIEVEAPIFLDEDYREMAGLDPTKLTQALKSLKAEIQKEDIERIGIILDIDRHSEAERIKFINDYLIKVFPEAIPLDRVNHFVELNFDDYHVQLACYFTNVDGQGELETVIQSANIANKPVRLRVLKGNPAKELYLRLGFQEVETLDNCCILERTVDREPKQ